MNAQVQIIEKGGKPEWAVIPYAVYLRLTEAEEMLQDVVAYDEAKIAIARGAEELIPIRHKSPGAGSPRPYFRHDDRPRLVPPHLHGLL